MCDNQKEDGALEVLPQHVRLSNHPGYRIKRPYEFVQKYGDYILSLLQMIKHGYTDRFYDIPPLDTRSRVVAQLVIEGHDRDDSSDGAFGFKGVIPMDQSSKNWLCSSL